MSLRFIRSLHYKRIPSYEGWWSQILQQEPKRKLVIQQEPVIKRTPISIPFEPIIEEPSITTVPVVKTVVYLNGEPIQLPTKPDSPENCCMR